jgi:hypothetical protein
VAFKWENISIKHWDILTYSTLSTDYFKAEKKHNGPWEEAKLKKRGNC